MTDNLKTHGTAGLYEAFEPELAHRLARRFEPHDTLERGWWLNIAEIERCVLARQYLNRRFENREDLEREMRVQEWDRNG